MMTRDLFTVANLLAKIAVHISHINYLKLKNYEILCEALSYSLVRLCLNPALYTLLPSLD